ncbi:hypothetical protein, partial [Phocaeicola sp.]|uniref:hypothetical protein n=1 Tax=Phocaeicola sp. TaxID=2773926 RepID=UPI003AB6B6D0
SAGSIYMTARHPSFGEERIGLNIACNLYLERLGEAKKIDHFCSRERGRSVRPTKITGSSRQLLFFPYISPTFIIFATT